MRCTDEVCKPPEGAVFKRYGAERSGKKVSLKRDQVRVRKLNESEPTEDMSKRLLVVKSINSLQLIRQTVAVICLPATEQPALRRQELYTGFYTKRERLTC